MSRPIMGIVNTRPDDEVLPVLGADFSKALLIETSDDADPAIFPLNEPVRFASNDKAKLSALGTGLLFDAVRGINAQLTGLQAAADITIMRVAEGTSETPQDRLEQTTANILDALKLVPDIPSEVNATPRLVNVGRTAWVPDENSANPIIAELHPYLEKLLAVAAVDAPDSSSKAALSWREKIQSDRIIPVGVGARVSETVGGNLAIVSRPMAPRILGLGIRIDHQHGGKPFDPWANEPVYGIVGTTRPIAYSMTDGAVEGQQLLEGDIGIVTQGETGVDTAIADGGFIYLGTDSCGAGDVWSQFHQIRGVDYLTVKGMRIARQIIGRKFSARRIESWIIALRRMLSGHVGDEDILGARVDFPLIQNTVDDIRLGDVLGSLKIEPAPVIKVVEHEIRRYREAVEITLAKILASIEAST